MIHTHTHTHNTSVVTGSLHYSKSLTHTQTHTNQHGDGKLMDGGNVYDMTYLHGTKCSF
jgi:hypothetical protein